MSTISFTKLYTLLTAKVGQETAENLTDYIEETIKDELNIKSQILATKDDLNRIDVKIKDDLNKLEVKISETRYDLIKWMFIFWIGQVAATFGFIFLFIKK